MKILYGLLFVIGGLALSVGIYCQLEVMPQVHFLRSIEIRSALENALLYAMEDTQMLYGSISLFGGILALIIGVFVARKNIKFGIIGIIIALSAIVLGLLQATHMFS